jgi:Pvc16 N-terminal domain
LPIQASFSALGVERPPIPTSAALRDADDMIPDVDQALKTLIEREAVDATEVEVVFDAPTKDWASRRQGPTVDVYLYDIREDMRRRSRGLINEYEGERVLARHMPPRYFKLSYLVAAWTQRPEDEHRLLASLLLSFLRFEAVPRDVMSGELAEIGLPVPMTVALPPPEDRSFADVWTALGGELKPSLDVVVTAPVAGLSFPAAPPVVSPPTLITQGLNGSVPVATRRGGATRVAAERKQHETETSPAGIRRRRRKSEGPTA